MDVNITQELDFLGAYQTCLKAMETDEFTGSLCKYYLEITEALRIAMENQSRPKGKWFINDTWKVELYGEYCACPYCKEWTINGRGMDKLNYCPNCGEDMRGKE